VLLAKLERDPSLFRYCTGVTREQFQAMLELALPLMTAPRKGHPWSEDRPPALWAPLPLTELLILAGLVLMGWGFLQGVGEKGNSKIAAGLAVASIAGMELSMREHVTGFRSHTTLLAGAVAIAAIVVVGLLIGVQTLGVLLITGLLVFGGSFYWLRELFKRKSGGLSFR